MKRACSLVLSGVWFVAVAAACSHPNETGGETGPEQDIKAAAPAPAEATHDPQLVAQWTTDGADHLLFHSLALRKDGTFTAVGGCAPNPNGGALHCFAIVLIQGTWKTSASPQQLALTDQSGHVTNLTYVVARDTVTFSADTAGPKSVFKRQPDPRIGAGLACKDGDECVDGFECRSNCPMGAMCLVQFNVCEPKLLSVKKGGVCGSAEDGVAARPCAPGLVCRSNCPEGAKCIVEIDTCQAE